MLGVHLETISTIIHAGTLAALKGSIGRTFAGEVVAPQKVKLAYDVDGIRGNRQLFRHLPPLDRKAFTCQMIHAPGCSEIASVAYWLPPAKPLPRALIDFDPANGLAFGLDKEPFVCIASSRNEQHQTIAKAVGKYPAWYKQVYLLVKFRTYMHGRFKLVQEANATARFPLLARTATPVSCLS